MGEDLDILCNSLNAVANLIAPTHIKIAELLLQAQAVITRQRKPNGKKENKMSENIINYRDKIQRIVLTYTNTLGYPKELDILPLDNGMYKGILVYRGECVGIYNFYDDNELFKHIFNTVFAKMTDVCMKMELK